MRSTKTERAVFYMQVIIIKIMYWKYWTYLISLGLLFLIIPAWIGYEVSTGKIDNYWEEVKRYYHRLIDSFDRKHYETNKRRLTSEIREKRKDL